jgi:hypothetical protein
MNTDNQATLARLISEQLGPEFANFTLDGDFGPAVDELDPEQLPELARQIARQARYAKREGFFDVSPDSQ